MSNKHVSRHKYQKITEWLNYQCKDSFLRFAYVGKALSCQGADGEEHHKTFYHIEPWFDIPLHKYIDVITYSNRCVRLSLDNGRITRDIEYRFPNIGIVWNSDGYTFSLYEKKQ